MTADQPDWREARLGEIADFRNGVNYTKDNFGRGVKVINVKDFQDYTSPKYETLDEINPDGVVRPAHLLRENDVIFVRSNGNRELIGRSLALLSVPPEAVTHSAFTIRARLHQRPELNPRFFAYVFRSGVIRQVLSAQGSGANISNLNQDILERLVVPLPPREQQDCIAAILSAYDDLIETNTRRISILEEMARRLYEEWFVYFRFPGHKELEFDGGLPSGWSEVPLGTVANITWGDTKTTKKSYVDAGFVAYSAAGPDGFLPHFDYDRTGIVLSAIGAKCGLTWFARGKWSCIKNTIRLFSNDQAVSDEYLFLTTGFSDYWPKRGAAQPFISQGDAKQCKVVVPPEALHERFLAVARPALKQAGHLRLANANLRAQRDLVLPKLVSGEIDVSRAEAALEAAE